MTVTDDKAVTGEIVTYQPATVAEYQPRIVMTPDDAKALDDRLREGMRAILRENTDYGPIPGQDRDKKNLLKPGAEKLLQWFGFGSRSIEVKIERDDPDHPSGIADKARRIGVTYRTEITKTIPGGGEVVVATCEGYAGYDEDRYFQVAEQARAKAKAKEEGFAKADGRQARAWKWETITEDYRAPWNTVVKMAQKRSYVGAAIDATGAAGLFTQDMEDTPAPEASPAASIASAASEVVASLPEEVRRGVESWRKKQDWPRSSEWDAAQWCAALVQAGRLDAMAPGSLARSEAVLEATDDLWMTKATHPSWVDEAIGLATELPDKDSARALYKLAVFKEKEGEITAAQKDQVCNLITARMADLDATQAKEGTVAVPDGDPWQDKIATMSTREDAIPLLDELEQARTDGKVDGRRYKALKVAIRAKADGLPSAPGEDAA